MVTNPDGYQVYKTLVANMMATTAYLENNQPPTDDPKDELHHRVIASVNATLALEANRLPPPNNLLAVSRHTSATISSWRQDDPSPRLDNSLLCQATPPRRQRNSPPRREDPPRDARDDLA